MRKSSELLLLEAVELLQEVYADMEYGHEIIVQEGWVNRVIKFIEEYNDED